MIPIIKREELSQQIKDNDWDRKWYNKKLKELAILCKIEKTYMLSSRHSFASQAMLQEKPINAISTMLGHSSFKTTEAYLKSLPNNVLDDYNTRILHDS